MGGRNEKRRGFPCEGRTHYRSRSEGDDAVPFRPSASEVVPSRDISMIVVRNGSLYHAQASIQTEGEGTYEWMAVAIAVLGMSVDMAVENE